MKGLNRTIFSLFVIFMGTALLSLPGECAEELFFKFNSQYERVMVQRILSADTIVLEDGEKIKLIGLKAPLRPRSKEKTHDKFGFRIVTEDPTTSLEAQAYDFTKNLVQGQYVRLEFDDMKKSDEYYTLAYAFLADSGTFINAEILRYGFASLMIRPPNTKYADTLREAYLEARKEKRGLQGQ